MAVGIPSLREIPCTPSQGMGFWECLDGGRKQVWRGRRPHDWVSQTSIHTGGWVLCHVGPVRATWGHPCLVGHPCHFGYKQHGCSAILAPSNLAGHTHHLSCTPCGCCMSWVFCITGVCLGQPWFWKPWTEVQRSSFDLWRPWARVQWGLLWESCTRLQARIAQVLGATENGSEKEADSKRGWGSPKLWEATTQGSLFVFPAPHTDPQEGYVARIGWGPPEFWRAMVWGPQYVTSVGRRWDPKTCWWDGAMGSGFVYMFPVHLHPSGHSFWPICPGH